MKQVSETKEKYCSALLSSEESGIKILGKLFSLEEAEILNRELIAAIAAFEKNREKQLRTGKPLKFYFNFRNPNSAITYFRSVIINAGYQVSDIKYPGVIVWNLLPLEVGKPVYVCSDTDPETKITGETWPGMAINLLWLELKWLEERENATKA